MIKLLLKRKVSFSYFLITLFVVGFLSSPVQAQNNQAGGKTIAGTILDSETNDPIPGVNVMIKGTTTGTATDLNGKYEITANSEDILVFSYIGYLTKRLRLEHRLKLTSI